MDRKQAKDRENDAIMAEAALEGMDPAEAKACADALGRLAARLSRLSRIMADALERREAR